MSARLDTLNKMKTVSQNIFWARYHLEHNEFNIHTKIDVWLDIERGNITLKTLEINTDE